MNFVPPILDCSLCSVTNPNFDPNTPEGRKLAAELHKAFTEVGFAYIINHGVPEQEVEQVWSLADEFYKLPVIKDRMKEARVKDGGVMGWIPMETEIASGLRNEIGDFRESYNFMPHNQDYEGLGDKNKLLEWPNDDVLPNFLKVHNEMFDKITILFVNFLRLFPVALQLKDPDTFMNLHRKIGKPGNYTTIRASKYPPIKEDVTDGQRCGFHTDFGTLTFLMQDNVGGLELKTRNGQWVQGNPIDGALLIFPADTLGYHTSGQYRSTEHGLHLPDKTDERRYKTRRSLIYFGNPDCDVSTAPLDRSDSTFPNMLFGDYYHQQMEGIY